MSLPASERSRLEERLDNLKGLVYDLKRFQTRTNCGPDDKHRLRDAESVVNQAVPWIEKCIDPPPPQAEPDC